MNFAIPYSRNFKYKQATNIQYNINYRPDIKALDIFVKNNSNKRINLIIQFQDEKEEYKFDKDRDLDIIAAVIRKYPQTKICVCFPFFSQDYENFFNERNIPHYYGEIVKNWSIFNGFLTLNITDVFIGEELCFDLTRVKKAAKEKGILLRTYCNVAQNGWYKAPSLKSFFIRPEDVDIFQSYFDTLEFYDPNNTINTLYRIYSIEKRWFGALSEIIVGYNGNQDGKFLLKDFGRYRIDCQLDCIKSPISCKICDRIVDLGKTLEQHNLYLLPQEEEQIKREVKFE